MVGGCKSNFTPTKKGGAKSLSHAESVCVWGGGGGAKHFGEVLIQVTNITATLKAGCKKYFI